MWWKCLFILDASGCPVIDTKQSVHLLTAGEWWTQSVSQRKRSRRSACITSSRSVSHHTFICYCALLLIRSNAAAFSLQARDWPATFQSRRYPEDALTRVGSCELTRRRYPKAALESSPHGQSPSTLHTFASLDDVLHTHCKASLLPWAVDETELWICDACICDFLSDHSFKLGIPLFKNSWCTASWSKSVGLSLWGWRSFRTDWPRHSCNKLRTPSQHLHWCRHLMPTSVCDITSFSDQSSRRLIAILHGFLSFSDQSSWRLIAMFHCCLSCTELLDAGFPSKICTYDISLWRQPLERHHSGADADSGDDIQFSGRDGEIDLFGYMHMCPERCVVSKMVRVCSGTFLKWAISPVAMEIHLFGSVRNCCLECVFK